MIPRLKYTNKVTNNKFLCWNCKKFIGFSYLDEILCFDCCKLFFICGNTKCAMSSQLILAKIDDREIQFSKKIGSPSIINL